MKTVKLRSISSPCMWHRRGQSCGPLLPPHRAPSLLEVGQAHLGPAPRTGPHHMGLYDWNSFRMRKSLRTEQVGPRLAYLEIWAEDQPAVLAKDGGSVSRVLSCLWHSTCPLMTLPTWAPFAIPPTSLSLSFGHSRSTPKRDKSSMEPFFCSQMRSGPAVPLAVLWPHLQNGGARCQHAAALGHLTNRDGAP